jgi:hypothetical protein
MAWTERPAPLGRIEVGHGRKSSLVARRHRMPAPREDDCASAVQGMPRRVPSVRRVSSVWSSSRNHGPHSSSALAPRSSYGSPIARSGLAMRPTSRSWNEWPPVASACPSTRRRNGRSGSSSRSSAGHRKGGQREGPRSTCAPSTAAGSPSSDRTSRCCSRRERDRTPCHLHGKRRDRRRACPTSRWMRPCCLWLSRWPCCTRRGAKRSRGYASLSSSNAAA